jgi:hypothetical protein
MNNGLQKLLRIMIMLTLAVSPMRGVLASPDMSNSAESMSMQHEMPMPGHSTELQSPLTENSEHNCDQCCEGDCCDQTCNTCVYSTPIILSSALAVVNFNTAESIPFIKIHLMEYLFTPLLQPPIS